MKKLLFSSFFFMASMVSLFAVSGVVQEIIFYPSEYYVGDEVVCTIILQLSDYTECSVPERYPDSDELTINQINLRQDGKSVHITINFKAYVSGSLLMPAVNIGPMLLDQIPVFVTPLTGAVNNEIRPVKKQVLLPGTKLYTALGIMLLVAVPVLLFYLIRFLYRKISGFFIMYFKKRPYRKLSRSLKRLNLNIGKLTIKDFYIHLTDSLKLYLTERIGIDFRSATTKEVEMRKLSGIKPGSWNKLVQILKKSDLIKFAGKTASLEEKQDSLSTVENIILEVESMETLND